MKKTTPSEPRAALPGPIQKWVDEHPDLVLQAKYHHEMIEEKRAERDAAEQVEDAMRKRENDAEEGMIPLKDAARLCRVAMDLLEDCDEFSNIAVSDFACLIDNNGTDCERLESLIALAAIADRVHERMQAAKRSAWCASIRNSEKGGAR